MIQTLILAHFLGDYALQTGKMVEAKQRLSGLLMHIGVHVAVLFALTWGIWPQVYGYLLLIGLIHFLVDTLKSTVSRLRPKWVIVPYLADQVLHLGTIFLVGGMMDPSLVPPLAGDWQKFLLSVVLATQVWFISERILFHRDVEFVAEINQHIYSRAAARLLLLSAIYLSVMGVSQGPALAVTWGIGIYASEKYRGRVILIDIAVSLLSSLVLFI